MSSTENGTAPAVSVEEIQRDWHELLLRVEQLEAGHVVLEQENKKLRKLIERVIEHRQQSHGELVSILTTLVSKLPINDIGVVVARLMEHNKQVGETGTALTGGKGDDDLMQPAILKTLDKTRRDLTAAVKPLVEDLLQLNAPLETALLEGLIAQPESFFAPAMARASRCFVKGQIPRERIVREFGDEALIFFKDVTTDVKHNPRPKPEEIILVFAHDFEALLQQNPGVTAARRTELLALYQKVQDSRAATDLARAQKSAFLKLSFVIELLHYYDNQSTESPDVIFAQRLPPLIEQLALPGGDPLDEKWIHQAETLLAHIIKHDHRQAVINNLGKSDDLAKTLRFVLSFRVDKPADPGLLAAEFIKHLIPPDKVPAPETLAAVFQLVPNRWHQKIVESIQSSERLLRADAETLGRAVARKLGLAELSAPSAMSPEKEQQLVWERIKELIASRASPADITAAIRSRLHAKYDTDELRVSWVTLAESDAMTLVRVFCLLPYQPDGKTDPIARTVLESYASRLTHEKYAATYAKVVGALRNLFKVKADSPALTNFITLMKWVDPETADKLARDIKTSN